VTVVHKDSWRSRKLSDVRVSCGGRGNMPWNLMRIPFAFKVLGFFNESQWSLKVKFGMERNWSFLMKLEYLKK
jgi:hypothetical protein